MSHQTENHMSSTFECLPTRSFLDLVHRKFCELVVLLCSRLEYPLFTLSLHMNFGHGMTSSSQMAAEPNHPWSARREHVGHTYTSQHMTDFVQWLHGRFHSLVLVMVQQRFLQHGRMVSIAIDMGIGFVASFTGTFRVTVDSPFWSLAGNNVRFNGAGGGTGGGAMLSAHPMFHPIPSGMTWSRFCRNRAGLGGESQTSSEDDMSNNSNDENVNPDSNDDLMAIEWQPNRQTDAARFFDRPRP